VPAEVRVLALAWLVLPLGVLVAACVCAVTLRGAASQHPAYVQGVIIHGEGRGCGAGGLCRGGGDALEVAPGACRGRQGQRPPGGGGGRGGGGG
jgi:hypothetical protein